MAGLVLDENIRNWVLVPITLVMFLVAILRHNIAIYFQSEHKTDLKKIQETQTLLRARRLRTNANKLQRDSFLRRKNFFNDPKDGVFKVEGGEGAGSQALNPMMDPMNMMDMMKKNITMIVPQLLIVGWVNYFFSGFLVVHLPFGLTLPFRGMLQRGVELQALDVSYVSSFSWYFLNLFGLRGVISLVLGEANAADDARMMQQQMMMGGGMGPVDVSKLYKAEHENLEIVNHEWTLEKAEERLLAKK